MVTSFENVRNLYGRSLKREEGEESINFNKVVGISERKTVFLYGVIRKPKDQRNKDGEGSRSQSTSKTSKTSIETALNTNHIYKAFSTVPKNGTSSLAKY